MRKSPEDIVPRRSRGRIVKLSDLTFDPGNPNDHDEASVEAIASSLAEYGQQRPVVVTPELMVVAGEGTCRALSKLGCDRAWVVESDLDEEGLAGFSIADNATAERSQWNAERLARRLQFLRDAGADLGPTALSGEQLRGAAEVIERESGGDGATGPKRSAPVGSGASGERADTVEYARECQARWGVEAGQVWGLGEHLVACRDSREIGDLVGLITGPDGHVVATDPPYCSGGFQEAGRASGTWGEVASDSLSSRGYSALMRSVMEGVRPSAAYVFTDWRMWVSLFDVVESCGLPVRAMIVWNKGAPGLGGLWRTQHELVMFSAREGSKRQAGMPAIGNVLDFPRTGNNHHYTEKPVELLAAILGNDESSPRGKAPVIDPFGGSGTTLLACEQLGRRCLSVDVEPLCVAVTLSRWEKATGKSPQLRT